MLYDSFGRPIRKSRFFGFAQTPANEPTDLKVFAGGQLCDAIGFALPCDDEDDDEEEEEEPII